MGGHNNMTPPFVFQLNTSDDCLACILPFILPLQMDASKLLSDKYILYLISVVIGLLNTCYFYDHDSFHAKMLNVVWHIPSCHPIFLTI